MARATVLGGVSLQVEVVMRSNESKVVWYVSSRVAKKNVPNYNGTWPKAD